MDNNFELSLYQTMVDRAKVDINILGLILAGSRARNLQTTTSDYDIYLIFTNEIPPEKRKEYDIEFNSLYKPLTLDLTKGLLTLNQFAEYAALGTPFYFDRYNLIHGKIEFDKTNGEITKHLKRIEQLSSEEQKEIVHNNLGDYISHVYRSLKRFENGQLTASIIHAADSVGYMLTSLFALYNRVRPFNEYLAWELTKYPLPDFKYEPQEFTNVLIKIIQENDMSLQRDLYLHIEDLARQKGFGYKYDEWGEKLHYIKTAKFS